MDERLRVAFEAGRAAAERGEEAAPGCTATPEGHAFLAGYIEGRRCPREPLRVPSEEDVRGPGERS